MHETCRGQWIKENQAPEGAINLKYKFLKIGISSKDFLILKSLQVIPWINGLLQWDFSKPKSQALRQIALTGFTAELFPWDLPFFFFFSPTEILHLS